MKRKRFSFKLFAAVLLFFSFTLSLSYTVYAYFNVVLNNRVRPALDVDILFGRLDATIAEGEWGSDTNPYLIESQEHLINLYVLQNSSDSFIINESSVFQVSNSFNEPIFVGGTSANNLFNMVSVGTEEYPFVSSLRGVTTTDSTKFVTLPTGERSDTSVLGNIRIVAKPGQVDIGLFGSVGVSSAEGDLLSPDAYPSTISTLLLYNIALDTSALGTYTASHNYYVTSNFETNHIGILAGHIQYVNVEKISVYYSHTNNVAHVNAFNVTAGSTAKYSTSGGIIGYFRKVVVDGDTDLPVSSDGSSQGVGSDVAGLGLGIVYSEDIWTFMEKATLVGDPAPLDSYNIGDTFGPELYGPNNTDEKYFHVGVFTFAHSKEAYGKDRLAKLWSVQNSNEWTVATNGSAGYQTVNKDMGPATRYKTTQITKAETLTDSYGNGDINTTYRHPNYRYMFVYESNGEEYALMRYGSTAIGQRVDTANLVIPDGELEYYTFEVLANRSADISYPPYEAGYSYRYHTSAVMQFKRGTRTTPANRLQYAVYGKTIYDGTTILEAPRPLRINAQSIQTTTPTTSFMATASTTFVEGIRIAPRTTTNFTEYMLQRTGSNGSGSTSSWYTTFSPEDGFSATDSSYQATYFKLYAVRITPNSSNTLESPVPTRHYLEEKVPLSNAPQKTYNTEENVLFYTGDPTSALPSSRLSYEMTNIESLGWSDNEDEAITKGSTALMMSDPTSYYYIRNSAGVDRYFGVILDIPSPVGTGTINVPQGSIGFTINGTGNAGDVAKVFVIVATDPMQGVDQQITISRFGSGSNQVGDRQLLNSFVLPPAPKPTSIGSDLIYLKDGASTYSVYPNFNTLLVAYIFSVPAQYNTTYFLEASRGSARFVYLSGERLAANDNNPLHENDIGFPPLTGIDYVFLGRTDTTRIATVGSPEYIASLTSPYFGLKTNPTYNEITNPNVDHYITTATTGFDFTYNISRSYNPSEDKYYLYIRIFATVNGSGYTPPISVSDLKVIQQHMNFNFSEWSYLDRVNYRYVYSDVVYLDINGYNLVDWRDLA